MSNNASTGNCRSFDGTAVAITTLGFICSLQVHAIVRTDLAAAIHQTKADGLSRKLAKYLAGFPNCVGPFQPARLAGKMACDLLRLSEKNRLRDEGRHLDPSI